MDTQETPPKNKAVGERLGMSESGVSRLRTGDRLPSLALMQKIEAVYGWSVQSQSEARASGVWASDFELTIAEAEQ